jgi:hypothetical protein
MTDASKQSRSVSDETLMAYADGELDDAEARVIGRAIQSDPALAARLQVFRITGRSLAPHFDGVLAGDPPASMLEAIRNAPVGRVPPPPSLLASLRGFLDGFGRGSSPWPAIAGIAAGVLIGAAATQLVGQGGPAESFLTVEADGRIFAAGELARVLETVPSAPADERTLGATSTFESIDDRFCRLYRALKQTGLACRNAPGDWQVLAMAEASAGAGQNEYGPSGGSGSSAVADLANQLMKSEAALDPGTEAALIARKWEAR